MAKNGHNAKAMQNTQFGSKNKYSVWVKKQRYLKLGKNVSKNKLELFCGKNGSKKQLIFEK